MTRTMVGVFHDRDDAVKVVEALKVLGYRPDDISVVVKDRHELKHIEEKSGTRLGEELATGAVTGGFLGGLTGLLVGIGLLAIPGIGPVLAAGPISLLHWEELPSVPGRLGLSEHCSGWGFRRMKPTSMRSTLKTAIFLCL